MGDSVPVTLTLLDTVGDTLPVTVTEAEALMVGDALTLGLTLPLSVGVTV